MICCHEFKNSSLTESELCENIKNVKWLVIYIIGYIKIFGKHSSQQIISWQIFFLGHTNITALYGLLWLNYSVEEDVAIWQQADLGHTLMTWTTRRTDPFRSHWIRVSVSHSFDTLMQWLCPYKLRTKIRNRYPFCDNVSRGCLLLLEYYLCRRRTFT